MSWYERGLRWAEGHRLAVDTMTATGLALVFVPPSAGVQVSGSAILGALVAVSLIAPLAWRRTRPVLSVATVYSVGLLQMLLGTPTLPADVAVPIALFSVTVHGPRWAHRTAILTGGLGIVVFATIVQVLAGGPFDVVGFGATTLLGWTTLLAVWAFGLVRRARRETYNALRDRAVRLERERDQQAQIATAAERARIAREMHDIVAHSLSVVVAQADGGRYAATADPAAATRALATISETGRTALADMRRLLGVLRDDDGPDHPVRLPLPDTADLDALVDQVRASGTTVTLTRLGTERPLPPGARLVLYRVAQESLTNVLKHAGPGACATLTLRWTPGQVVLEVTDDGRGAAATSDGSGHGLVGMRERVDVYGGTVRTGPRPGGGFGVTMVLPFPSAPEESE